MLLSLAYIFLTGLFTSWLFSKLKLPGLLGMLITGIILGPFALNLISPEILSVSSELRQIALVIILTRAGLSLDIEKLKKVGRPAFLLCFVPATFEITAIVIFAPMFFNVSHYEAAVMGTVLAAVSPAVIVPRMLKLMEGGYGKEKSIPEMIMAGASVDDVFVIVLFTSAVSLVSGDGVSMKRFVDIPVSMLLGALLGIVTGIILSFIFTKFHIRDSAKVIIILSFSFILVSVEKQLEGIIAISGLLAVMALGATLFKKKTEAAVRLSSKFSKLWVCAEIMLFVLVGATVDPKYALKAGLSAVALIVIALLIRMVGVFVCVAKTKLDKKERLFCALAYMPKATVQAAIGGVPLAMGLSCGNIVLTVAVVSIILTAPVGAFLIDLTYKKLLKHN